MSPRLYNTYKSFLLSKYILTKENYEKNPIIFDFVPNLCLLNKKK